MVLSLPLLPSELLLSAKENPDRKKFLIIVLPLCSCAVSSITYQAITYQAASTWNDLQNKPNIDMLEESNSKVKTALIQLYFNNYLN